MSGAPYPRCAAPDPRCGLPGCCPRGECDYDDARPGPMDPEFDRMVARLYREAAHLRELAEILESLRADNRIGAITVSEDLNDAPVYTVRLAVGFYIPSNCPCCMPSSSFSGYSADELRQDWHMVERAPDWLTADPDWWLP